MRSLNDAEQALVSRYVDGELSGDGVADFERRLLQEPHLREAVEAQREVREWFARAGDDAEHEPSRGFTDRVVQEARRLPSRHALQVEAAVPGERERDEVTAIRTGKGLLAAAALILGVTLLFASGWIRKPDTGRLEANDQKRIEQIDREREAAWQREAELRRR